MEAGLMVKIGARKKLDAIDREANLAVTARVLRIAECHLLRAPLSEVSEDASIDLWCNS